jgi:hypothetical protein
MGQRIVTVADAVRAMLFVLVREPTTVGSQRYDPGVTTRAKYRSRTVRAFFVGSAQKLTRWPTCSNGPTTVALPLSKRPVGSSPDGAMSVTS